MSTTQCSKCHYVRQPTDTAPAYECPRCGAFYELSLEPLAQDAKPAADSAPVTPPAPQKPVAAPAQPGQCAPRPVRPASVKSTPIRAGSKGSAGDAVAAARTQPRQTVKAKICPKCRYERKPTDTAPEYECPRCGIIYHKYIPPELRADQKGGGKRAHQKGVGRVKIPALPFSTKLAVHMALAIVIAVLFSFPEMVESIVERSFYLYWLSHRSFFPGVVFFAVLLAMVPAWLLIQLTQLWQRVQHRAQRTHWMMACIGMYLMASTDWAERLAYAGGSWLSFVQYLLVICGALGSLLLLMDTLVSLRDPDLHAHGRRKVLR